MQPCALFKCPTPINCRQQTLVILVCCRLTQALTLYFELSTLYLYLTMATYKVLQDIEAEDKLFGPFTLKQFIFLGIALSIGFVGFQILTAGLPTLVSVPAIAVLFPFFAIFGFLAAPIGQDQPNDVWLFARLRFLFKPRTRIWNQDGINNLVTVTAPKKPETVLVKNFTQDEVRSRLQALAHTVDSRGWAVKNVNTNLFGTTEYTSQVPSDRLIDPSTLPQEVSNIEVLPTDDMFDTRSSTTAQHLDQLVRQSSDQVRERARSQMLAPSSAEPQPTGQDYWFMNQPAAPQEALPQNYATFAGQQVISPGATDANSAAKESDEEKALLDKIKAEKEITERRDTSHMRVLQPLHDAEGNPLPQTQAAPAVPEQATAQPAPPAQAQKAQDSINPAVRGLADNNDLDIATIARQAKKLNQPNDDGEVVINLH